MEIGARVRNYRTETGMSQDDLAERVFVSRQTISSWENNKTYPDVQSLLLLSEIFGTSVDTLIKGDVEAMNEAFSLEVKRFRQIGMMLTLLTATLCLALIALVVELYHGWELTGAALPTLIIFFALWGATMIAALFAEFQKSDHDLITYQEIVDFWNGKEPDRASIQSQRVRRLSAKYRLIRKGVVMLLSATIGGILGYGAMYFLG